MCRSCSTTQGTFTGSTTTRTRPHSPPWGPRLYTFFLYLNNVPEGGGGGTRFSQLNRTVEAKRGERSWPSVLDNDPSAVRTQSDHRTTHEALTVTKGQKFAANMWLHQFDFQGARGRMRNEDLAEWRPPNPQVADEMPTAEELREEEGENRPPSLPEGPERFATGESMKVDDGEIVKASSSRVRV